MAWPRASLYRTTQNGRAGRVVIVRVVGDFLVVAAGGGGRDPRRQRTSGCHHDAKLSVEPSNEDSLGPPRLGFTRRFEAKLRYSYRSKRQRRSPAIKSYRLRS
jgi:hypothetical protein